jgi:hypothetical protein
MAELRTLDDRPLDWHTLLARNRARLAAQHILRDLSTDTEQRGEELCMYAALTEIARGE